MVHFSQRSDGSAARHTKKSPTPKTTSRKHCKNRVIIRSEARRGGIVARRFLAVILRGLLHAPTVSVLLPVWNGEAFLGEAMESILRQTLSSFELIVIDDGSS